MMGVVKLSRVLKQLDEDGDNAISYAEFEAAVAEANPEEAVASALSDRAKALFAELDAGGTGSVTKKALFAKLKGDAELESLLGIKDVSGKGMMGVVKLSRVLKQLDEDGDNAISYAEFEAAVAEANPEEAVASALSDWAKALFAELDAG